MVRKLYFNKKDAKTQTNSNNNTIAQKVEWRLLLKCCAQVVLILKRHELRDENILVKTKLKVVKDLRYFSNSKVHIFSHFWNRDASYNWCWAGLFANIFLPSWYIKSWYVYDSMWYLIFRTKWQRLLAVLLHVFSSHGGAFFAFKLCKWPPSQRLYS